MRASNDSQLLQWLLGCGSELTILACCTVLYSEQYPRQYHLKNTDNSKIQSTHPSSPVAEHAILFALQNFLFTSDRHLPDFELKVYHHVTRRREDRKDGTLGMSPSLAIHPQLHNLRVYLTNICQPRRMTPKHDGSSSFCTPSLSIYP
jgi:hypothetical protein